MNKIPKSYTPHTLWIAMLLLTLLTYFMGKMGFSGVISVLIVLVTAIIKATIIMRDFMALRDKGMCHIYSPYLLRETSYYKIEASSEQYKDEYINVYLMKCVLKLATFYKTARSVREYIHVYILLSPALGIYGQCPVKCTFRSNISLFS